MKKKLAGLIVLAMILTCCLLPSTKVYADDGVATLQPSSTEVTVGDTFTVTLNVALNEGVPSATIVYYPLVYDATKLTHVDKGPADPPGQSFIDDESEEGYHTYSRTFTFTAIAAGDAQIYATVTDPNDKDYGFGFKEPYGDKFFAQLPIPPILTIHVKDKETEPPTEEPTEPITDAPTEPVTDAPTEPVTDAPTQSPLSSNANLSSMAVAPGQLNEAFSSDRLSYTATDVENKVTLMNVGATTEDPNATLVIKGNSYLVVGKNTITIEVTAQDGTKKEYTIEVYRKTKSGDVIVTPPTEAPTQAPTEAPTETEPDETTPSETDPSETDPNETEPPVDTDDIEVTNLYDGSKPMLLKSDWLEEAMPAGFSRSVISYKGNDVAVAKSKKDMVLYCLEDKATKERQFYVYNSENDSFYPYYPVTP